MEIEQFKIHIVYYSEICRFEGSRRFSSEAWSNEVSTTDETLLYSGDEKGTVLDVRQEWELDKPRVFVKLKKGRN